LTTVGLGTWAIGGTWAWGWGPQDDEKSIGTIVSAVESGINWIDTAPVYGLGHSEEVVGEAIKQCSARPVVATKCGTYADENGKGLHPMRAHEIKRDCELSLTRLQVEAIDLYQIHWPNPDELVEEAWGAISDLVGQGKVRYGGVSNFSVQQLERIQPIHRVASLQPPYSMLRRDIEEELLGYCAEHQIGVICYSPMQKGILTDKFTRSWAEGLAEEDHRVRDRNFCDPKLAQNLKLVEGLKEVARAQGITVAQLAVAWVLRRPEVTAAIAGARKPEQIKETVAAGDVDLPGEALQAVEQLLRG
jgi:aryl-alcohol dehydrogenase-like predicted oxidoreductase